MRNEGKLQQLAYSAEELESSSWRASHQMASREERERTRLGKIESRVRQRKPVRRKSSSQEKKGEREGGGESPPPPPLSASPPPR
eukprot:scaffold91503_cov18-Tisochrysis_lutea.AAC.1